MGWRRKKQENDYTNFKHFNVEGVINWIIPPPDKNIHALIPGTCDYVTLPANENFSRVINDLEKEIGWQKLRLEWCTL